MTAEADAIGRAITRLERAQVNDAAEYWQVLLDDVEPFVDLEIVSNTSVAFNYVVALRDGAGRAGTRKGRAASITDAIFFFWQALRFPPHRPQP